jgi:Velvet factor
MQAILFHHKTLEPIQALHIRNRELAPMVGVTNACVQHVNETPEEDIEIFKNKGVFAFPDLSVRQEGLYRLKFHMFEIIHEQAIPLVSVESEIFRVFTAKEFPGMESSTEITEYLRRQGVKMRVNRSVQIKRHRAVKYKVSS